MGQDRQKTLEEQLRQLAHASAVERQAAYYFRDISPTAPAYTPMATEVVREADIEPESESNKT